MLILIEMMKRGRGSSELHKTVQKQYKIDQKHMKRYKEADWKARDNSPPPGSKIVTPCTGHKRGKANITLTLYIFETGIVKCVRRMCEKLERGNGNEGRGDPWHR